MHVPLNNAMGILINLLDFPGEEDTFALRESLWFDDEGSGLTFGFTIVVVF